MKLSDIGVPIAEVIAHPRHVRTLGAIQSLIVRLRDLGSPADAYEFQRDLLAHLLDVETARSEFSRAVKRMRKGGSPQAGAAEPESGDPALVETWQLERDVCERAARQLRSVGDALAWRSFNYQRQFILALCRNQPAGPMAGKDGLLAELDAVDTLWRDEHCFGLLHDLTNCLRIADLTEFRDRTVFFREIKTNPRRRDPAQLARIQQTAQALWEGRPLPGEDRNARLVNADTSLRTQLRLLEVALTRADQEGVFAVKASGRRAVVATDLYGLERQGWSAEQFQEISQRRLAAALRRARADDDRGRNVSISSSDHVARDPLRVPWACYPLAASACTRLIGDLAWFTVEVSGPALVEEMRGAGLDAHWVVPDDGDALRPGQTVIRLRGGARAWDVQRSELDRYLLELVQLPTWIAGLRQVQRATPLPGHSWPFYRDEDRVWV